MLTCRLLINVVTAHLLMSPHVSGYKPVIMVHGILGGSRQFNKMADVIRRSHPETEVVQLKDFSYIKSLVPMWDQVNTLKVKVQKLMTKHPGGVHFICYSQGGLICRGLLQTMEHNVDTFISISSPLAGQFGDTEFLKFLFPKFFKENIYKFFYTKLGQDVSIGNYWNDPHQQELFFKKSAYLAILNNQSIPKNPDSISYKENFLRLKKIVMIGGPNDGVIGPWQSAHFRYYDVNENVLPLDETFWYTRDSFGLKSLDKRGALVIHSIPGVSHLFWLTNDTVIDYILPYLT